MVLFDQDNVFQLNTIISKIAIFINNNVENRVSPKADIRADFCVRCANNPSTGTIY